MAQTGAMSVCPASVPHTTQTRASAFGSNGSNSTRSIGPPAMLGCTIKIATHEGHPQLALVTLGRSTTSGSSRAPHKPSCPRHCPSGHPGGDTAPSETVHGAHSTDTLSPPAPVGLSSSVTLASWLSVQGERLNPPNAPRSHSGSITGLHARVNSVAAQPPANHRHSAVSPKSPQNRRGSPFPPQSAAATVRLQSVIGTAMGQASPESPAVPPSLLAGPSGAGLHSALTARSRPLAPLSPRSLCMCAPMCARS